MRALILDSGTLINLSMNGLLYVLEDLKKILGGKFLITRAVKREVIDRPLTVQRFELGALRIKNLLDEGILEMSSSLGIPEDKINHLTKELMDLANHYIQVKGNWVHLVSEAEISCLALSDELTKLGIDNLIAIDERTTRVLCENPVGLEKIMEGKQKKEVVLDEAKDSLKKIMADFKVNEKDIGEELAKANKETRDEMSTLGKCMICSDGSIVMKRGKFGSFAACNKYPECNAIYSLPKNAMIKPAKKECEACHYPMVLAIKKGKRPTEFCINKDCKSKYLEGEAGEEAKAIAKGTIEKECPKCKEGKLVLRTSIYGKFLGCNRFPKCRHTERLQHETHGKDNDVNAEKKDEKDSDNEKNSNDEKEE